MRLVSFLIILLSSCFSRELLANETKPIQKLYIPAKDVALKDHKLWVLLENEWIQVNSLNTDAFGLFVDSENLPVGFWSCDRCGYVNYPWHFVCHNPNGCGFPR